jgi:pyruvate kinase
LNLKPGDIFEFTVRGARSEEDYSVDVNYDGLVNDIHVGDTVLVDNGVIHMKVLEKNEHRIRCEVLTEGSMGSRRHINLPGVKVGLPPLTEKDHADIRLGVEVGVDFVALSFCREASDILELKRVLKELGSNARTIAKIEDQNAVKFIKDIILASDAIMIARGDLGIECKMEELPIIQRRIIKKCIQIGRPVIVATHMLESMIENPVPTRAEITDVANAVFEQADAVMLSGETANGAHPVSAVRFMARTCTEAEGVVNYGQLFGAIRESTLAEVGQMSIAEAVASSAVKTAIDIGAKAILVCSETGNTARLVAKYRPPMPVLVLTATESVARQVQGLVRGLKCHVMGSMIGTDGIMHRAEDLLKDLGYAKSGDTLVAVHGQIEGRPGSTSLCRVVVVA